jgi:hypothetical protein
MEHSGTRSPAFTGTGMMRESIGISFPAIPEANQTDQNA